MRTYSEAETGCPVTYYFSAGEIRHLMRDFEIVNMRKDHIFPYVVDKYIHHEYEWMWYFRWLPKRVFRWLEQRLGWHTLVTARPTHEVPEGRPSVRDQEYL